jgi:hypothetical protein
LNVLGLPFAVRFALGGREDGLFSLLHFPCGSTESGYWQFTKMKDSIREAPVSVDEKYSETFTKILAACNKFWGGGRVWGGGRLEVSRVLCAVIILSNSSRKVLR